MVFIFDLDRTLLNHRELLRAYVRDMLGAYGVTWPKFEKELRKDYARRPGYLHTTPRSILSVARRTTRGAFPKNAERQLLRYYKKHAPRFYYPDVFRVIPALPGKKILLTRGSRVLQGAKMKNRAVRALFDAMYVTPRRKSEWLRRLVGKTREERYVFVDDWHKERSAALRAIPHLIGVHLKRRAQLLRPAQKRQPFAHPRCFVVQNLLQLKRLMPKIMSTYGHVAGQHKRS